MKALERKRLEDQISTGNAAGAATQAVFQGQMDPQPGAPGGADAAAPAASANVWGDTTRSPDSAGWDAPNAPPPSKTIRCRRPTPRCTARKSRRHAPRAILPNCAGWRQSARWSSPARRRRTSNTRELAHAQGVDIPTVPTTPGSTPEAASATLDNTERFRRRTRRATVAAAGAWCLASGQQVCGDHLRQGYGQPHHGAQGGSHRRGCRLNWRATVSTMAGTGTGVPPPGGTTSWDSLRLLVRHSSSVQHRWCE